MPTQEQMFASVCICQSLSNLMQPIHLFRYDPFNRLIVILGGINDGIEVTIDESGKIEVTIDE